MVGSDEMVGRSGGAEEGGARQPDVSNIYKEVFLFSAVGKVIGDTQGCIIDANPAFQKMMGYSLEELKNLAIEEFTHPEDFEKERLFFSKLFAGDVEDNTFRKRYVCKDGSLLNCLLTASVIYDDAGEPSYLIGQVQEISELDRVVAERERERDAFKSLYQHTPDILLISSADFTIQSINHMPGDLKKEDYLGHKTLPFVDENFQEDYRKAALKALHEKETTTLEVVAISSMKYLCRFAPLPDDEKGGRFLVIASDMSEVVQLRDDVRERDAWMRTITLAMPDIPFILNGEGRYVDVITDKRNLLYDTVSALKGSLMHDVLPREVADLALDAVRKTIESGESQSMDYRLEVPAGERWFEGRTAPIPPREGEDKQVVFVARDVTDRVEAINALKEATLFRDRILDTIPEIIYTYDFETRATHFANEKMSIVLSVDVGAGESLDGDVIRSLVVDEDKSLQDSHLEQLREAKDGEIVCTELRFKSDLGIRQLACRESVLYRDDAGHPREILGSAQDVTEARRTEDALRRSEERVRTFIESAEDMIYFQGVDGQLNMLNTASEKITGVPLEKLEKHPAIWRELVHPDDVKKAEDFFEAHTEGVASFESEYRILSKDGDYRTIWSQMSAARDSSGKIIGYNCIDRDVTDLREAENERRMLEERLKRIEKLDSLNVFAGAIAHNFNNLLMSVLGNLELAEMMLDKNSEEDVLVRDARGAARRAADLSRQMLVYVGQGKVSQMDVDLATLLEDIVESVGKQRENPIPVDLNIEQAPLFFRGDPLQAREVIKNVVLNAWEAGGKQGKAVEIRAGQDYFSEADLERSYLRADNSPGNYAWFEVRDHGAGMDEVTLSKMFDPFFSTKFTGRGLGLATVLGTVRGHGGAIIVESQPQDGTLFRVLFPETEQAGKARESNGENLSVNGWQAGEKKVLLIEDESEVARVCQRMLKRMGFEADYALDGETGVKMFLESPESYCCVLLDLILPGIDGEDVLNAIREQGATLPIVLSSGYSREEITRRFADKQLNGIIHKPYEYGVLLDELRRVLSEK
jgi:PAS domain S-box-containing protein